MVVQKFCNILVTYFLCFSYFNKNMLAFKVEGIMFYTIWSQLSISSLILRLYQFLSFEAKNSFTEVSTFF